MAQTITVIPYEYQENDQSLHFYAQSGMFLCEEMWPCDLTPMQGACRMLCSWLGLLRLSREDWDNFKQLPDIAYQELSYHVAVFSVLAAENTYFVPLTDLDNTVTSTPYQLDPALLIDRFNRSMTAGFFHGALRGEATEPGSSEFIPHPDFAVFHFNNYAPFKGYGEAWLGGLFMKPGETWAHYMIPDNQFPSEETLQGLKGIVMTGGRYAAYDQSQPWLDRFKTLLKRCVEDFPELKITGMCLGAQLFAVALGGTVEPSPKHGRIYKIETIICKKEFQEFFPTSLPLYNIPENHSDEITSLPPGAVLLGSSETCDVEVFLMPGKAFMTQSHPNYVGDFQKNFHAKRMFQRGILSSTAYQELLKACDDLESHSWPLIQLMSDFLRQPALSTS